VEQGAARSLVGRVALSPFCHHHTFLVPFISSANRVCRRGLAGAPAPEDLAVELRKSLTLPKSLQVRVCACVCVCVRVCAAFLCRWLRRLLFSLRRVTCVAVASGITCTRPHPPPNRITPHQRAQSLHCDVPVKHAASLFCHATIVGSSSAQAAGMQAGWKQEQVA